MLITPQTKVAELLDTYPHLENVLIEYSSAFSKLKNPMLRKTIARVASLQQAAIVAGVKVDELVNRLRKECGQANYSTSGEQEYIHENASWFDVKKIVVRFDATAIINQGDSPMATILKDTHELKSGEIFELTTPFIPAPIIDILKNKGFDSFTKHDKESFITYFIKL